MNNSYITIIKEKRTVLSRKRVPLNQNECTADFRIGVPFEQNLQLLEVHSKSSHSITEQILQHPGEKFNVAPFVHGRCKAPIEEIKLLLMVLFQKNKRLNSDSALITLMN